MKHLFLTIIVFSSAFAKAQVGAGGGEKKDTVERAEPKVRKTLYGTASYYAEKFNGRETANGEIYDSKKMTAACNVLPMGTWIRVTNLSNNRWVIVKTNDRLHSRMTRVVDLSRTAAEKLGYITKGLTKVRVEVLERVELPPKK
ncbi:MAG TPA: septal ring lytic transglycosylase RlpA family protein [Flavisolibacter sp.]|nr:septal ring lytic transglycosylase RlpA family protein [Flavisolibacter sp.]